jgi:hypothetical protein
MSRVLFRSAWALAILFFASALIADTPLLGDQFRAMGQLLIWSAIWWGGDAWIRVLGKKSSTRTSAVLHVYTRRERVTHALPPLLVCLVIAIAVPFLEGTTPAQAYTMSVVFVVVGVVVAWRRWKVTHAEVSEEKPG